MNSESSNDDICQSHTTIRWNLSAFILFIWLFLLLIFIFYFIVNFYLTLTNFICHATCFLFCFVLFFCLKTRSLVCTVDSIWVLQVVMGVASIEVADSLIYGNTTHESCSMFTVFFLQLSDLDVAVVKDMYQCDFGKDCRNGEAVVS